MTREQAIQILDSLPAHGDAEVDHGKADTVLVELLLDNGFSDVAAAYMRAKDRVGFLYA